MSVSQHLRVESEPRESGTSHCIIQGNRAVLVDPPSTDYDALKRQIDGQGLLLRYVLYTASEAEHSPMANGNYTHLLATLGAKIDLDLGLDELSEDEETAWDSGFAIRPLDRSGEVLYLECGIHDLALDPSCGVELELTHRDEPPERAGSLALPFGRHTLAAIPLPGARLAWRLQDRVFWPGRHDEELPMALGQLPPSTLLYTSAAGAWLTSIQQRRWCRAAR